MKVSVLALTGATALAAAQHHGHNHMHHHPARQATPVVERDVAGHTVVEDPVATVFDLNGKLMPWSAELEQAIKDGSYVVIGDDEGPTETIVPTSAPAPPPPSTSAPAPKTTAHAAQFVQKEASSSVPPVPFSSSSAPPPPPPSSSAAPLPSSKPAPVVAPAVSSGSGSGYLTDGVDYTDLTGVNTPFPDGKVACSDFPSQYGARAANWLGIGSWTGVQQVPGYTFGVERLISEIVTAVPGMGGCTSGSMCSYACPNGYAKTQWTPASAQGATGQSIGGLYCGSDNMLHMTNSDFDTLCTSGAGNLQIQNNLSQEVCFCATDYPGTESETIATCVPPGGTRPLFNTLASNYYQHLGADTSNQVYINPAGNGPEKACVWGTDGTNLGNYSPLNLGASFKGGMNWIGLLPNSQANQNPYLGYNVAITGDGIVAGCKFENEQYSQGAGANGPWTVNPSGCTATGNANQMITVLLSQ